MINKEIIIDTVLKKEYKLKQELGYNDLVQDHHIIPKEFKEHGLIQDIEFDVGCSKNIMMIPTLYGNEKLNLPNNTLTHYKGHRSYNDYVKYHLDDLYDFTNFDESKYHFMFVFLLFTIQIRIQKRVTMDMNIYICL